MLKLLPVTTPDGMTSAQRDGGGSIPETLLLETIPDETPQKCCDAGRRRIERRLRERPPSIAAVDDGPSDDGPFEPGGFCSTSGRRQHFGAAALDDSAVDDGSPDDGPFEP